MVERGQDLLWRYDIDPVLGLENLVWAPRSVAEQHGKAALQAVVDALDEVVEQGADRAITRQELIDAFPC